MYIHISFDTRYNITFCEFSEKNKTAYLRDHKKPFYKYLGCWRLEHKDDGDAIILSLIKLRGTYLGSMKSYLEMLMVIIGQFYLNMTTPVKCHGVKFVWIKSEDNDVGYWRTLDAPVKIFETDALGDLNPSVHFNGGFILCKTMKQAFKEASILVKRFKKEHCI